MRKFFCVEKRKIQQWLQVGVGVFFAFVVAGHFFYSDSGFNFATAHAASIKEAFTSAINWFLYYVAQMFGLLGVAGATLFTYVLDTNNVKEILGNKVIDLIWTIVRDVLNLSFILILLFSAFATIFQIERYHLRNVLTRLIIMALLVNFSLPIAKVIIDASNILMYFFVNNLFPKTENGFEILEIFGKSMNIVDVFIPKREVANQETSYIFMAIIFAFFYGISMITIAGLLVVRLVALAILMIFSPIGFVGAILPSTQGYAQQWWQNLFKYAFTGPILVFMLFFSMSYMHYVHKVAFDPTSVNSVMHPTETATTNEAQASNMTNLVFLMIPIVILWAGIIMTNATSDGASQMVTRFGQGMARKTGRALATGGKYASIGTLKAMPGAARATGFARSFKVSAQRRRDRFEQKANAYAEQMSAQRAIIGRSKVQLESFAKSLAAAEKELKDLGLTGSQLVKVMEDKGESKERRVAAARLAAQKGMIDSVARMNTAMSLIEGRTDERGKVIERALVPENLREDFAKEIQRNVRNDGRRDVVAAYRIDREARGDDVKMREIIRDEFRIGAEELGKQKRFDALHSNAREMLKEHVDNSVVLDAQMVRDALKGGNAEVLRDVSDNIRRGIEGMDFTINNDVRTDVNVNTGGSATTADANVSANTVDNNNVQTGSGSNIITHATDADVQRAVRERNRGSGT